MRVRLLPTISLLAGLILPLSSCGGDSTNPADVPFVTSVSPTSGPSAGGTVITVTGGNFPSSVSVTFGGTAAAAVSIESTTLAHVTTPPHAPGAVDVTVKTPDGQSVTKTGAFTFIAPPTLTSVTPSSGSTAGGTTVTLKGTDFQDGATVSFGDAAATGVVFLSDTALTAATPSGAAGSVDVIVTNPDAQSDTLTNGFAYVVPPTVANVTPSSGPAAGGTAITVTGTGFQSGATVTVGGAPATGVTVGSATSLTASTPPGTAGAASVVVTNPDGGSGTLTGGFTFVSAPQITSVTPTLGPLGGGTPITITGSAFLAGATVTVGGNSATGVNVASATSITATTPAHAAGATDVVVTNPDGQSGTKTAAFTFAPPPTVSSVSPSSSSTTGGGTVTITGTGFFTGATVDIGGVAATGVTFGSSTSLTATVPPHAAGVVDVVVTNPDGQSGTLGSAFTYAVSSLTISSLSRDAGSAAGGATVLVNGGGFVAAQSPVVSFGGTAGVTTFVSSTQLSVVTPAHAAGQVDVTVSQNSGAAQYTLTGVLPNGGGAFDYLPAPTTTYVSEDFEGGTLGSLTSYSGSGSVSVQTVASAVSGTHAVVCTAPTGGLGSAGSAALFFGYSSPKQPALSTNGVYQRWYIRLDQETIDALAGDTGGSDQMKVLLDRADSGNPPSWFAMTWGYSILGDSEIKLFRDFSGALAPIVGGVAGHTGFKFNQHIGEWIEIETHFVRSGGIGHAQLWIDGKLIADDSDSGYGTDDTTKQMIWDFGISYYQDNVLGHTMTMDVDNVKAANGFIDPGN